MLVWDEQSLMNRCRNQPERVRYLIEIFLREIPTQMATLTTQKEVQNIAVLKEAAHSIKGMAANLGGLDLQRSAARLEKSASNGGEQIFDDLDEVLAAYRELELELNEYLSEF